MAYFATVTFNGHRVKLLYNSNAENTLQNIFVKSLTITEDGITQFAFRNFPSDGSTNPFTVLDKWLNNAALPYVYAAYVHDWYLRTGIFTELEAHRAYYKVLRMLGVKKHIAIALFLAVSAWSLTPNFIKNLIIKGE